MLDAAKNVALYIRVSTEEQAVHGLSVDAQTAALDNWARNAGVRVVDHYIDAGISARKKATKRPELQRLLSDVRAGRINLIVFTKLDRWFRNIAEYYKVQEVLEQYHVDWMTIHEDYDTTTSSGRLKINIMLSVAQDEADRTGERIKAVFASKRERNEPVSGQVPTGYKIENKQLVKDPHTEPAISAYFDHYLKYGSITKAIDYVAEHYGLHLKYQLASKLLEKSVYYGTWSGIECPPYITPEEHEKIVSGRRKTARKATKDRVYLFSGLAVCGECGARLGARPHIYKGVFNVEYNCPGHYQKKGCPSRTNMRESNIEAYLLDRVESALDDVEVYYRAQEKANDQRDYAGEIAAVKRKLGRLKELYLNELIDINMYRQDFSELTDKLHTLNKEKEKRRTVHFENVRKALSADWRSAYDNLDRAGRRAFWRVVISEVRVYGDRHIEFSISEN